MTRGKRARALSMETGIQSTNHALLEAMYGLINVVILAPVCVSFTSIIFSHPTFAPHLPSLTKLVMFSSAVHQLCFTLFSSMPFAVGQVQDAGLIFLSSMAYYMVDDMQREGLGEDVIITTVLVVLSVCTCLLGVALVFIGRLRLAMLVQYIPVPVIGGYLAFIGFFCGKAGIVLMTGLQSCGARFLRELLLPSMFVLWFPGVCLGVGMYLSLRSFASPYVLPIYMCCMLLAFYVFLALQGWDLQDARAAHLIAPLTKTAPFYESWFVYQKMGEIAWDQLPKQFFRWCGMFVVVAFSSSLDVAAIEMELNRPLDYNMELQTVGVSNVLSGLLGGYTGSYIFSQTIFTMRRKVSSRVCGCVIVACELLIITFPFAITSYIPKLFFGAFLTLIAVDLMYEWLVVARKKIKGSEFLVCWLTFLSMQCTGVEAGLVLGIIFSTIGFVFSYADITAVEPNFKSSTVVRTFRERALLLENRGKLVTLSLHGHIFFGSAVKLLEEVKRHVVFREDTEDYQDPNSDKFSLPHMLGSLLPADWCGASAAEAGILLIRRDQEMEMEMEGAGVGPASAPSTFSYSPSMSPMKQNLQPLRKKFSFTAVAANSSPLVQQQQHRGYGALDTTDSGEMWHGDGPDGPKPKSLSTEYLVLDFERVIGIDATAARSCFLMLVQLMHQSQVVVVFTNMKPKIEASLRANLVITDKDIVLPLLDDALEWCEEHILSKMSTVAHITPNNRSTKTRSGEVRDLSYYTQAATRRLFSSDSKNDLLSPDLLGTNDADEGARLQVEALQGILRDYLGDESKQPELDMDSAVLLRYFERNVVHNDTLVFDIRGPSNHVYFLEEGEIELVKVSTVNTAAAAADSASACFVELIERVNKVNSGGIFGESDFFLSSLHSVRAFTIKSSVYWTLSRECFRDMEREHPQLCLLIQRLLLKSLAISTQYK